MSGRLRTAFAATATVTLWLASCGSDADVKPGAPAASSAGQGLGGEGSGAEPSTGAAGPGGETSGGRAAMAAAGEGSLAGAPSGEAGTGAGGIGAAGASGLAMTSVEFTKYGELTLTFSEDLPGEVEVSMAPELPAGFVVSSVSVAGAQAIVQLAHNQLPVDYTLAVTIKDGAGDVLGTFQRSVPASETKSLLGFVSKAAGNGDMRTWAEAPAPVPASPIEAGNAICQAEAEAAGFSGTFLAWLPTTSIDPVCLVFGLAGKASNNCGRGGALALPDYAWVRPDGLPLIAHPADVDVGLFRTRLALFADGGAPFISDGVWAGQLVSTPSAYTPCLDWTSTSSQDNALRFGTLDSNLPFRISISGQACDTEQHLICLQRGETGVPMARAHARPGRRVFATEAQFTGALTATGGKQGVVAGDQICAEEATAAGLTSDTGWAAWLSDSTADAACHIDGLSGTLASSCAAGVRPADRAFVRVDGVVLATGLSDLLDGSLNEPAGFTAGQGGTADYYVWTGTYANGASSGAHCNDFKSTSDVGSRGIVVGAGFWSWLNSATSCATGYHLLCMER